MLNLVITTYPSTGAVMTVQYYDISASTTDPFQTWTVTIPSDTPHPFTTLDDCFKCFAVGNNLAITVAFSDDPSAHYSLLLDTTITVSNAVLVTSSKTLTADFAGLTVGGTYYIRETCTDDDLAQTATLTATFVSGSAQFTNMQVSPCSSDRYLLVISSDDLHSAVTKITIT